MGKRIAVLQVRKATRSMTATPTWNCCPGSICGGWSPWLFFGVEWGGGIPAAPSPLSMPIMWGELNSSSTSKRGRMDGSDTVQITDFFCGNLVRNANKHYEAISITSTKRRTELCVWHLRSSWIDEILDDRRGSKDSIGDSMLQRRIVAATVKTAAAGFGDG